MIDVVATICDDEDDKTVAAVVAIVDTDNAFVDGVDSDVVVVAVINADDDVEVVASACNCSFSSFASRVLLRFYANNKRK